MGANSSLNTKRLEIDYQAKYYLSNLHLIYRNCFVNVEQLSFKEIYGISIFLGSSIPTSQNYFNNKYLCSSL